MKRIVTGTDAEGKSRFVDDLPEPGIIKIDGRPGFAMYNMWQTTEAKPFAGTDQDMSKTLGGLLPPEQGTFCRVVDFPPDIKDPEERRRVLEKQFKERFGDVAHKTEEGSDDKEVGMHQHPTVDYAVVMKGTIDLILDRETRTLTEGDVVIQRGVNHRWANVSDDVCRMMFVQIDAHD